MNQSCVQYKRNKKAHDLNEAMKNHQTATTSFFLLAFVSNFQLFNYSIFIFTPEEKTAKQKLSGSI